VLAWYKRHGADVHAVLAMLSFIVAILIAAPPAFYYLIASFLINTCALVANVWAWHDKE
jgi:hypothetical protein